MTIFEIQKLINFDSIDNVSKILLKKNGISFQNFINVEENSELMVELLSGKKSKNLVSEIGDVFITLQHVINSFNIKDQVNASMAKHQHKHIDDKKLCMHLAQLNKEITKNLNRDNNNLIKIVEYVSLVNVGLLKYIHQNNYIDLTNTHISKKLKRTVKRNKLNDYSTQDQKKKDWDEIFLLMAYAMASGAHCVSRRVGALLVKNKRIISTGINGTPEGCQNCDEIFPEKTSPEFNRTEHHKFSTKNEIHAEMNALLYKAKEGGGYNLNGATLYCTTQPCDDCLKNIVQSGVTRIVYAESYDLSDYSEFILDVIKIKKIELVHKPLLNTTKPFVFIQDAMTKTQR